MNRKPGTWLRSIGFMGLLMAMMAGPSAARDAAFIDPNAGGNQAPADGAFRVEPKSDIVAGESILNVPRRTTLFFVNQTTTAVQVDKISVNNDGNVLAEVTNDDCTKQGTLQPSSRCSVEISVTPTSPGAWSVEALLTHNGAGRIARAKITGKTSGSSTTEKKDMGLALSNKDIKPVDFGEVDIGEGKIVRSALMVNDSPEAITLYSIDVIEADNGLQRLDQGCAVDMELKPGESCPVTLVWDPSNRGLISTDLIIRHSGRLGFAVIPIRGVAKGNSAGSTDTGKASVGLTSKNDSPARSDGSRSVPPPPSANDLAKLSDVKIPPVSATSLGADAISSGVLRLIGTVGNRVVLLKPDGMTAVVQTGDEIDLGGQEAKVLTVGAKSADLLIGGKKKTLTLQAAPELTERARASKISGPSTSIASGTPLNTDPSRSSASLTPAPSSTPLPGVSSTPAPGAVLPTAQAPGSGNSLYGSAK